MFRQLSRTSRAQTMDNVDKMCLVLSTSRVASPCSMLFQRSWQIEKKCSRVMWCRTSFEAETKTCPSHNTLLLIIVIKHAWNSSQSSCMFRCISSLSPHITTCTKNPIGSNALWDGHDMFSCLMLSCSFFKLFKILWLCMLYVL